MNLRLFFVTVFTILLSFQVGAGPIGKVVLIKGQGLAAGFPIKMGSEVKEGDTVKSLKKSFIRLKMKDETIINLGPESEIVFKSYKVKDDKRNNVARLLMGKMRVIVRRFATGNEKIEFNTGLVSLGVRGTEFLVNAYPQGSVPVNDTLLLKGELIVSGAGFERFDMSAGEYFNSQDLMRNGMSALKNLKPKLIKRLLENGEELLPKLSGEGAISDLGRAFNESLGIAGAGVTGAIGAAGMVRPVTKELASRKKKTKKPIEKRTDEVVSKVKGVLSFQYDLKNEPWPIRDAVLNSKKNKGNNDCFYFFYKKLPGAGEPELFRRQRDCDEFDYEL